MPAKNAVRTAAAKNGKAPRNGAEDKSQTVFLNVPIDPRMRAALNKLAELDSANQRAVVEGLIHAEIKRRGMRLPRG